MKHDYTANKISPITLLSLGYLILILTSAVILSLPFSSTSHVFTSYLDSLFTVTSAITTTGLIVFDTGTYYNLFGQVIIILLFQIGGLGYMLFVILVFIVFQQRISIQSNLMLHESIKKPLKVDILYFLKMIILFTLTIEIIGAIILSIVFYQFFPLHHSIYSGIFHSISAFNTAGFSIYHDSFCTFGDTISLNIVIMCISTCGSLGFFVLHDIYKYYTGRITGIQNRKLSVHSRIVLICTAAILIVGSILVFVIEYHANDDAPLSFKLLSSLFQVSSASTTTGFNSIDIGMMKESNLFLIIIMMFIGAGSGGTAGGIKMTTLVVTLCSVYAILRNKNSVNIFKRRLPFEVIRNSFAIFVLSLSWQILITYILSITENKGFVSLLFETGSALGTVGLSTGITADLSSIGKVLIILSMFIGRIGPLGIGISLLKGGEEPGYKYSTTDIFIG
ncbi:MAG: Trk family potassium uptake protein [Spirochaetes bacterium]|nr:Trk family potassium uptake protein [Spirochaetota bacterium]